MARILIIDDDEGIIDAMTILLEQDGHQVETSFDTIEALACPTVNQLPDIILIDVLLSGHDGRQVCSRLKAQPHTSHIPVIMISAHPSAQESITASGADDFLAKPFNIDDLEKTIARHLSNTHRHRRTAKRSIH
jgi:DNA-binding response OmpR family regulator